MTIPIIFVLDSSGSMQGNNIEAVNAAMQDITEYFPDFYNEHTVAIGILSFSSNCQWYTNGLVSLENYSAPTLIPYGPTDLGSAIQELGRKLTHHSLLSHMQGEISKPVIIYMSDGIATDNWQEKLEAAEKNPWFRNAARISVGIGDYVDDNVLMHLSIPTHLWHDDPTWRFDASYIKVKDAPELRSALSGLFKHSVLDGYSQLDEESIVKSNRIINRIKTDQPSIIFDEWD